MRSKGPDAEGNLRGSGFGPPGGKPDRSPKITRPEEAESLVDSALEALEMLEPLISRETELFRTGKLREALGLALDKNEAAQHYTRCLELLKSNAIAIGRFKPAGLELLKKRHEVFSAQMSLNMAAVSTARGVSERLLRDLADAVGQNASPRTYARGMVTRKAGTAPLAISKLS